MSTGGSRDIGSQELAALDVSVQTAEEKLRDIQGFITQERQAVVKARALIRACAVQRDQLHYISSHLPAHLPQAESAKAQTAQPPSENASTKLPSDVTADADENTNTSNIQPAPIKQAAGEKKRRPRAPRRYALAHLS